MEQPVENNDFLHPRKRAAYQKALLLALGLSIVLNIFILVAVKRIVRVSPVVLRPILASKNFRPSLLLDLAETPESARREKPPEQAKHYSDKNALAQNPAAPQDLPIGEPFSKGSLQNADSEPRPEIAPSQAASSKPPSTSDDQIAARIETVRPTESLSSNFRREFLTGGSSSSAFASRSNAGLDNSNSRAPELGNFSLNTYAWDFAPYMLWLKNHVQRNIHPPPAFTRMGIISGNTVLRFRISRGGVLEGMELLGYEGHKALMETSLRAIQLSAPFRALPKDFPEDYLEVTAYFEYTVKK